MLLPDKLVLSLSGLDREDILRQADEIAAAYFNGTRHQRIFMTSQPGERTLVSQKPKDFFAEIEYESVIER